MSKKYSPLKRGFLLALISLISLTTLASAQVNKIYSFYAHLQSVSVSVGQYVNKGDQIGIMGSAGSGYHVHWGASTIPPDQFYSYYQHASENEGLGWIDPEQIPGWRIPIDVTSTCYKTGNYYSSNGNYIDPVTKIKQYTQYEAHHTGTDLGCTGNYDSPIYASDSGTVVLVERNWKTFAGWDIFIEHNNIEGLTFSTNTQTETPTTEIVNETTTQSPEETEVIFIPPDTPAAPLFEFEIVYGKESILAISILLLLLIIVNGSFRKWIFQELIPVTIGVALGIGILTYFYPKEIRAISLPQSVFSPENTTNPIAFSPSETVKTECSQGQTHTEENGDLLKCASNGHWYIASSSPQVENQPVATSTANTTITPSGDCQVNGSYSSTVLQWCSLITQSANQQGIDPNLVAAVMTQESGGDPNAYSSSGAVGLLQVMPSDGLAASFICQSGPCFADRPSSQELYNPETNVQYGTGMLAGLISRYGNIREALKSYGPMDVGYSYADIVLSIYYNHGGKE